MASQYSPKTFLRQVRGALLNRCLRQHGIDLDLNLEIIKPAVVDEMFERLMSLPPDQLRKVEEDFAAITAMASRDAAQVLLDEAERHELDLSLPFAHARNDYERACWVFVQHRQIFELAACFHEMDCIGAGRWKRRFVGRDLAPATDPDAIQLLQSLMRSSYAKQGRGRHCHIDYYLREQPQRHCFFAYPEDHTRTDLGYDESGELRRKGRRNAFEVIFVYRPEEGVLEIMAPGGRAQVEDLACCFCTAILGLPELPAVAVRTAYDLDSLKMPGVSFPTDPQDGIELVQLREVLLTLPRRAGWQRRLLFSADPKAYDHASVHQMIVQTVQMSGVPLDDVSVAHARFCMVFSPADNRRGKRLNFTVSRPDTCSLKDGHHDQIARKYLYRWGFIADQSAAKIPA